jgi:drug/metabolite transporter (DMT)-like permease
MVSLLWGMNWPTQGLVLREIPPWTLRATTLGTAGLILIVVSVMRGESLRVRRRDWAVLILFTLLYIVVQNILISFAQVVAPSGRMAIVTFTMPIWTTILAALLLHERLTLSRIVSLVFGAAGLGALAWPALHAGSHLGWLLALGSAWCWAASVILIKRFPITVAPLAVATWQLVIGGVLMCVGMLIFEGPPLGRTLSMGATVAVLYNIASQSISQVLWFSALERLPAALAALGVLLVPTVAVLGSMLILHEEPTLLDGIGLVLITCASASVQLPSINQWRRERRVGLQQI